MAIAISQIALKTTEQRKELLAQQIAGQIRSGRRVESQSDYQAAIVYGRRVNHILHFLLGFVTFGLWWLVWIMLAVGGGERRELVTVDELGNVSVQKLPRS